MTTYTPHLTKPEGFTPDDREMIQQHIAIHNLTHVRTKIGETHRITIPLNEKSIPLNDASTNKTRVNYPSVKSFGIIDGESELDQAVKELTNSGVTIKINPSPRGIGQVTNGIAESVERVTGTNPIETPPTVAEHAKVTPDHHPTPQEPLDGSPKHEDRAHAILSASGASRWLNCTPSARLEEHHPDSTSEAAEQGTAAHELAEHKLRTLMGIDTTRPESHWHDEEMEDHTDNYADHCIAELDRTQDTSPAAFLSIEERLNFSHLVPDGFGTGDAVIVGDGTMTIVDLKYGKGVEVSAEHNPQMMLYALGAINTYGMIYDIQQVRMVIYQPRRDNISVWETSIQDLLDWADTVVKPKATQAFAGEGQLQAGDWCQFCRHAPQCTALAAKHFEVIPEGTTAALEQKVTPPKPDTLTDEQIAQIVLHSGDIKKWLTTVEKHALDLANTGTTYKGLKLVTGRSVRRYTDTDTVAKKVTEAGKDPWKPRELIGITDMTKLLGKKQFNELLGGLLDKPEGKPTLVAEADARPALSVSTPETVFNILEETA